MRIESAQVYSLVTYFGKSIGQSNLKFGKSVKIMSHNGYDNDDNDQEAYLISIVTFVTFVTSHTC